MALDLSKFEVIHIDPGNNVVCDWCDKDWTDNPESGGFLFQSKATCPDCADDMMEKITRYNEQHFIRDSCPEGVSFADWVRGIR
jgi:hypothetical protein